MLGHGPGVATRRYHGLLIAALPAPLGRIDDASHLSEKVRLSRRPATLLGGDELGQDELERLHGADYLVDFRLEFGLPMWQYEVDGVTIEKQILLPHGQNTVFIIYRLVDGHGPVATKAAAQRSFSLARAGGRAHPAAALHDDDHGGPT